MIFAALIFVLSLLGIVIGVRQVRRGMRGIAIDDHPCCGRCGYDMVNVAIDSTCPECGSPKEVPRRIGNRARQPRHIAIGYGLLGVSALVLSSAIYRVATPGSIQALAPLWVLRAETRIGSLDAIDEVAQRVRTGSLSGGDVADVVDEALAERHGGGLGTRVSWGDVIDAGLASGTLDQARTRRCFEEAVGVNCRGGFLAFEPAVGPSSNIAYESDIESATIDGSEIKILEKQAGIVYHHVRNTAARDTFIILELPGQISGKNLIVRWRIKIKDATTGMPLASDWVHTETIALGTRGSGDHYVRQRETCSDVPEGRP